MSTNEDTTVVAKDEGQTDVADELVRTTQQQLDAIFSPDDGGDDPSENHAEPSTPEGEPSEPDDGAAPVTEPVVPVEDPSKASEGVEPPPDGAEPEEGVSDEGGSSGDENAPTLPSAYRRSLQARGWDEDEINGFFELDPEKAMRTFDRIHQSRVSELAEWSRLGREAKDQSAAAAQPEKAAVVPLQQSPSIIPGSLEAIDTEKLIEEYGNEAIVNAIAKPVNKVLEQLNAILPSVRQGVEVTQRQQQEVAAKMIEDFFGDESLKSFKEFYGSTDTGFSSEQLVRRNEVLQSADAMVAGAQLQGRQLSVPEALAAAHEHVARDQRHQAARSSLKTVVKKRAKGLTTRPSRTTGTSTPRKDGLTDLERRTQRRMRKVFRPN